MPVTVAEMCDSRLVMEARFLLGVGIWEDEHPFISLEGYAAALPAHLFFFFFYFFFSVNP